MPDCLAVHTIVRLNQLDSGGGFLQAAVQSGDTEVLAALPPIDADAAAGEDKPETDARKAAANAVPGLVAARPGDPALTGVVAKGAAERLDGPQANADDAAEGSSEEMQVTSCRQCF
jgi:hypothetical protein